MKTFTIEIKGNTQSDIELAIEEIARLVSQEFLSGFNSNDTGSFTFDSTGEYEPEEEDDEPDDDGEVGNVYNTASMRQSLKVQS